MRYADLPDAVPVALEALDARAARGVEVADLVSALAPLVRLSRCGDVRGTDDVAAWAGTQSMVTRGGAAGEGRDQSREADQPSGVTSTLEAGRRRLTVSL